MGQAEVALHLTAAAVKKMMRHERKQFPVRNQIQFQQRNEHPPRNGTNLLQRKGLQVATPRIQKSLLHRLMMMPQERKQFRDEVKETHHPRKPPKHHPQRCPKNKRLLVLQQDLRNPSRRKRTSIMFCRQIRQMYEWT